MRVTLRPYQEKGVGGIRKELGIGRRAVLFVLPTGGGKTITYAAIAEGAAQKGNRVLILEHRKELIRQASLAVGGLGVRHRVIVPANKMAAIRQAHVKSLGWPMIDEQSHVAVASVQTLARRMEWLQEFDPKVIIIDEAHHAVAGTWARIIEALPRAKLIGVTATPCRTDWQGLGDVFDSMVLGPTMAELIELGNLVPPRVFAPSQLDLTGIKHSGGDFDSKAVAEALGSSSVYGDAVHHYKQLAAGRPAIAFCINVAEAKKTAEQFRAAGFRFEVVTGEMDDDLRDRHINGLADGRLDGIATVDVVSEGTDIPVAEVAILLRPTESESLYLQQVGRVLRPADGKEYGLVLDHVGNVARHGLPHADREWTLEGRKKTKQGKRNAEPTVRILQCDTCYFVFEPAPCCPQCGASVEAKLRQLKKVEAQLEEVTEAPAPKVATGKLQTIAAMKAAGISTGRAAHIMAAREEKARLQNELRDLLVRWAKETGQDVAEGWGFSMSEVRDMKPKALRENIEKVGDALFMGASNDNKQTGLALA